MSSWLVTDMVAAECQSCMNGVVSADGSSCTCNHGYMPTNIPGQCQACDAHSIALPANAGCLSCGNGAPSPDGSTCVCGAFGAKNSEGSCTCPAGAMPAYSTTTSQPICQCTTPGYIFNTETGTCDFCVNGQVFGGVCTCQPGSGLNAAGTSCEYCPANTCMSIT